MARDPEAKIRLTGDAKSADKAIKKTEGGLKKLANFVSSKFVFTFSEAQRLIVQAFDAINRAAEQLGQRKALERNLQAQGIAIDEFIGKLKDLSDNQIATTDLILASNRALKLGIAAEDLPGLLSTAANASVELGVSVTQAFNDITTGVGRASPLILDNLGIVVDANKVYSEFAASIGVATEELTKQQKTIALTKAVIASSSGALDDFSKKQSAASQAIGRVTAALKNFRDVATKEFVDRIGDFATAVSNVADKSEDFVRGVGAMAKAYKELAERFEESNPAIQASNKIWEYHGKLLDALSAKVASLFDRYVDLGRATRELKEAEEDSLEIRGKINDRLLEQNAAYLKALGVAEAYGIQVKKVAATEGDAAAATGKLKDALKDTAAAYESVVDAASVFGEVTSVQLANRISEIALQLEVQKDILGANSDEYIRYSEIGRREIASLQERIENLRAGLGDLTDDTRDAGSAVTTFGSQARDAVPGVDALTTANRNLAIAIGTVNAASTQQLGGRVRLEGGGSRLLSPAGGPLFPGLSGATYTVTGVNVRQLPNGRIVTV